MPSATVFADAEAATHDMAFPIVGIGASAGGLEALEQLLAGVPARQRHGLCRHPASRPQAPRHAPGTAAACHDDGREAGGKPDEGQAGLRLCHSAQQGSVDPARRALPARADGPARAAPADRLLPDQPGRRPARTGDRRHPLRHGFGWHGRPRGDPQTRRPGPGADAGNRQVRCHAAQRDRCRAGRHRRRGRRTARADPAPTAPSACSPRCRSNADSPAREFRLRESLHPVARANRA